MQDRKILIAGGGRAGITAAMLSTLAAAGMGVLVFPRDLSHVKREPASTSAATPRHSIRLANAPGCRYPEQSSRQALRGMRRAQGGPGIELVASAGQYVPRLDDTGRLPY